MRKIILYIAMSLDGFIANTKGGVDWLTGDGSTPEQEGSYPKFIDTIDTVIIGWNTYQQITEELSPGNWPYAGMTTYVLTHRIAESSPEILFTSQAVTDLATELKKENSDKHIWICGGASVIQQLLTANLIDEYHISIIPALIGDGIRLFQSPSVRLRLRLTGTQTYNGITDLVYERF